MTYEEFKRRKDNAGAKLVSLCKDVYAHAKEGRKENAKHAFDILVCACDIYLDFVEDDLSSVEYAYSFLEDVCCVYDYDYSKIIQNVSDDE